MDNVDIETLLSQLTLAEKVSLTAGRDFWHTVPVPRLKIPSIRTSDGPNGVRGTRFFNSVRAACLPCATALGSTFDSDLIWEVGQLLARECHSKGVHILLGPTINIQRSPLGGRGFESFSEDPVLSGTLAGQYCDGLQKGKVMATVKHFVCNDQEHERMSVNTIVTPRALREIYLMPFMLAIKMGRPACVMTAYNKVNNVHASENKDLIDILRKEWKWEGLVMSDWYGTYSTSKAINAGTDLEMPGPTIWRGQALERAVIANKVKQIVLDDRVRNVLNTVKNTIGSGIPHDATEGELNKPEDRKFLRRIAAESIVLLKNSENGLPFDKSKKVALIGPNTKSPAYAGGGSATLNPYYTVSPFEGISNKCSDVEYSVGAQAHKYLPLLDHRIQTPEQKPGFRFRVFDKPPTDSSRTLVDDLHLENSSILLVDYKFKGPEDDRNNFFVDINGTFTPDEDGTYDFGLIVQGFGKLFIDEKLLVDNTQNQRRGDAFFGHGTVEEIGSIQLSKRSRYSLHVEFSTPATQGGFGNGGFRVGCDRQIDPAKAIEDAVELASRVEQTAVFVGLNSDWESESFDRPDMDLPGAHTDDLVRAVLKANPRAVIVLHGGTPVTMPWADDAKSIVQAWYGGNEAGNGLADVLFGDINPSGKLSVSFPRYLSDNPSFLNWGSERGRVLYGEDVYVGYRYYDRVARPALFPFGHGLSYTAFEMSKLEVSTDKDLVSITLTVKNIGPRDGAETVQVYVAADLPSISRPVKELKAFKKVRLAAGEAKDQVEIKMELKYATSFWDEDREAWTMEKGSYRVLIGNSSRGEFLQGRFKVKETIWWSGL